MKRSQDRILTTHAGSLPRPADLLKLIQAKGRGEAHDSDAYAERVRSAVAGIVASRRSSGSTWSTTARWARRGSFPTSTSA